MRLLVRSIMSFSLAAVALGCSDSTTQSESVARRLVGTWDEPLAIPGEALELVLATHNTTVSGTGTFSHEAQGSGTVTVAGAVSGSTIDFDVTFDYGAVMHFRGNLAGATLNGIWYSVPVGDPTNIVFDKVQ
ncbi:MAG: hypothetical protein ACHQRL_05345 [Gemmatimonadales bacterium]